MAKKDKSTSDQTFDRVLALIDRLSVPVPDTQDPFAMIQFASSAVKLAEHPDAHLRRTAISDAIKSELAKEQAQIDAFTKNNS